MRPHPQMAGTAGNQNVDKKPPHNTSNAYLLDRWLLGRWIHERLDLQMQAAFSITVYLGSDPLTFGVFGFSSTNGRNAVGS